MKLQKWIVPGLFSACCVALVVGSLALAQEKKDPAKKDAPKEGAAGLSADFKLPPGWTAEDLKACMIAGTPGKMQQLLAEGKGEWSGKCTMWMYPGAEPMVSDNTSTVTSLMDGRFTRVEVKGEIPGMGPYHGIGVYGYDNVSKKFVSSWIDNHSTGIMQGEGELSKDEKVLSWKYNHSCPITGKPTVMKEVETIISDKERKLEMWGADPKSGKEFKMMQIEMTRK
jgi:hypothetical protein